MMREIAISKNKRHFQKGDRNFFYLADTVWSAFSNTSFSEWQEYLDYRKMQGFNALQINILPQWDASGSDIDIQAFVVKTDGTFDFFKLNEAYFDRAEKMIAMAVERGFLPALVLLWCNFVPDTWSDKIKKCDKMPLSAIENYVKCVAATFSKYNPIYIISGDSDFPTQLAKSYYGKALALIKKLSPECLTTMHIQGRLMELPEEYTKEDGIDFYMYQSGHNTDFRHMAYVMANHFYHKKNMKPVLNSEPCYDQMGFSRRIYGRFTTFDVRKAAWQSVLSGASAGITYGAHGIWSWHKPGKNFGATGEGFDKPYYWRDALKFEGAWDYSFLKWIFETYDLFDLKPQNLIANTTEEIRMAMKTDRSVVLVYMPSNTTLTINDDLSEYSFDIIDLTTKRFAKPVIQYIKGQTIMQMHNFQADVLFLGTRR